MLQVFGPTAITREIDEAESRFKEALSTRRDIHVVNDGCVSVQRLRFR